VTALGYGVGVITAERTRRMDGNDYAPQRRISGTTGAGQESTDGSFSPARERAQMKTFLIALLTLILTTAASGQQEPLPAQAQLHRSSRKIWIGVGLISAGALILPITNINNEVSPPTPARTGVGLGLVAVGGGLVWFGSVERHKAVRPQTNIGVMVGRYKGLQLRTTW